MGKYVIAGILAALIVPSTASAFGPMGCMKDPWGCVMRVLQGNDTSASRSQRKQTEPSHTASYMSDPLGLGSPGTWTPPVGMGNPGGMRPGVNRNHSAHLKK